jgi:hypothetical protein
MRSLRRFLHRSSAERAILLHAVFSIVIIRVILRFLSLPSVQHFLAHVGWRSKRTCAVDRIVWAIRVAARLIPRSSCLAQALAAQSLLVRHSYESRLTIGVRNDDNHRFEAHAWVTSGDEVLIGGPGTERYTALLNLSSLSRT